ncbi:MAG TPA: allantoate amidohydrolase [Bryobacteraceae bacterium]|jgi:allantoate deiminase
MTAEDVISHCYSLATHSEELGFTSRPFLSPSTRQVHQSLTAWMERAGMQVRVDAVGNLRGFYPGERDRRLLIASHLDTVRDAGAFDGVLGVVLGIALVEALRGRKLAYGIEIVGLSEEEGVRFSVPFLGSRALVGTFHPELFGRRDAEGITVAQAIRDFGLDPDAVPEAQIGPEVFAYFEFHIEQGPVLDQMNLPVAVVHDIAGQSRASVTFRGEAGHAGTTPMNMRHDALTAAAEWIVAVEEEARQQAGEGLVATVGQIHAEPGSANVIPGTVRVSLDVRHHNDSARRRSVKRIATQARHTARVRGLSLEWEDRLDQPAVSMSRRLSRFLEGAVKSAGFPLHKMTSGAGHDAMILAPHVPSAMLFLRSPGGISHHPKEAVLPEDVQAALDIGSRFLEAVAGFG